MIGEERTVTGDGNDERPRRPPVLEQAFRVFFPVAALHAAFALAVWLATWFRPHGAASAAWHGHEMLFGYAEAVVAGFVLTTVPDRTGHMPRRGGGLLALLALWGAGRAAALLASANPGYLPMLADIAFPVALAAIVGREARAARTRHDLRLLVPLILLAGADIGFHLELRATGQAGASLRLALSTLVFLTMTMGGRLLPSYTRNRLARRAGAPLPAPAGRFDRLSLVVAGTALALWCALPTRPETGAALLLAAALHAVRLGRWRGAALGGAPLLLSLHVAYGFIPLGIAALGLSALGIAPAEDAGRHLLGIGTIGGLTLGVMARLSLALTGREQEPRAAGALAAWGLFPAAVLRALVPFAGSAGPVMLLVAGLLWILSFALFAARFIPWFLKPRAARRRPGRARPAKASGARGSPKP